jgi:hypothetical protein
MPFLCTASNPQFMGDCEIDLRETRARGNTENAKHVQ